MLTETFCHIQGVGRDTERSLWEQGCLTWADYLANPKEFNIGSAARETFDRAVKRSTEALAKGNHQYFAKVLGTRESWRAWPEFRKSCVYLDIETDGGNRGNAITTIGLYDGAEFTALIRGVDLENYADHISRYSMIVTFYGAGFDLPMLAKRFPLVLMDHLHLDLCFALKKVGVKGGLKKIEKQMGIARGDDTDGLTGLDAVRLWREYQYGRQESLDQLIAYNREDVVNLERLAEITYKMLREDARPANLFAG